MRRFWFCLLVAAALASSGVASALAWTNCPLLERAAQHNAGSGHDCCPDERAPGAPVQQPSKQMGNCIMGHACRAAPAMTPTVAPMPMAAPLILPHAPIISDTGAVARAPDAFWRPPRTI